MKRSGIGFLVVVLAIVAVAAAGWRVYRVRHPQQAIAAPAETAPAPVRIPDAAQVREALFAELQPVTLTNCTIKRFGERHDGGYLLCANLLKNVKAGYSYGISGYDGWGCAISRTLKVQVHEYDCFNLQQPACRGGETVFHEECVAGEPSTDDAGRRFETPEHQFTKNGDASRHLVMKIDVEGAEWNTFLETPDSVLEHIDQLAVEFHGVDKPQYVDVVRKLKRGFYIANLHFNNYSCSTRMAPFPAWAYEVLFVNKHLGVAARSETRPALNAANAPNNPDRADCQVPVALRENAVTGKAPGH